MGKKVKELVTYWGPAVSEWGDGTEKRYEIERDEDLLLIVAKAVGKWKKSHLMKYSRRG